MKPLPLPDDMATLWFLVRRVGAELDRTSDALFRSELGVSLAQFLVLSVVEAHPGPLNQQAVAERVGLTKGTVSRQIDQAVSAGLMKVEVAPHSRRENSVSLTPEGNELVRRGDELAHKARKLHLPKISGDDMAVTIRTLAAMKHALAEGDA